MIDDCLVPLDYESRNLSMASYALVEEFLNAPDHGQLTRSLTEKAERNDRIFAQAKVTREHMAAVPLLESCGFSFVETSLVPHSVLSRNAVLKEFLATPQPFVPKRFDPNELSLSLMAPDDCDTSAAVKRIAAESFVSDRFHVDPQCPAGLADRRYVYWVDDLLTAGVTFHILMLRNEIIGFMARRKEHLVLAGFARTYAASGLGDYLWLGVLGAMLEEGVAQAHTQISTNNIPVLNLYVRLGFKFKDPTAIFHLWGKVTEAPCIP